MPPGNNFDKRQEELLLKRMAELLKAERNKRHMSQLELAKRLGTSQAWVARVENGYRYITLVEYCKLATTVGFDPKRITQVIESA
jgi:transcriptional regulator with XRE-family HTH domain